MIWQACKAAGHFAYKEQAVPQWGRWIRRRRRRRSTHEDNASPQSLYVEAILDVVSFDPSTLQHYFVDSTVRNSLSKRYLEAGSSRTPGVALRRAAEQKLRRYPDTDTLRCIMAWVDQFGFISDEFCNFLEHLAAQAAANDAAHARPSCNWLKGWLLQISSSLTLVQASAVRHSAERSEQPFS